MDPLSDVLSLLKPRSYMFRGFDAGGPWSLRFPASPAIRCYALLCGSCWLMLEDAEPAVRLVAGDCILLTSGQAFCLASDTALTPVDAVAVASAAPEGGVVTINEGGGVTGLGGFFNFDRQQIGLLLAPLPPVMHVQQESEKATLRFAMETMMAELRDPRPGAALVAQQLAQTMLVLVLRRYLAQGANHGVGWLAALADPQMAAAIHAIHDNPAHRWTVQSLAQCAYMSRSSFAQRFNETVGLPVMEYLVRWRMMLAADRLLTTSDSIATIGHWVGYESGSAFSAAFRRVIGCAPRQYAKSVQLRS